MEHVELKDTMNIQLASVDALASVLGYYRGLDNKYIECREFYAGRGFKGCEVISLNTMVKLHNSLWCKSVVGGYYFPAAFPEVIGMDGVLVRQSPFMLDGYTLNKALAARIAEKVFIQCNKHGVVTCHKHLLKLADDSYYYLFIGE
jgi:hypothetical protein